MTGPELETAEVTVRAETMVEIGSLLDIGVLTVDAGLIVTGWNEWLERATGKPRRDIVGKPLTAADPSLRPAALAAFDRAIQGSGVFMSQAFHEHLIDARPPNGFEAMGRMRQSVRILPLRGEDGTNVGAIAFIEDVTERVAREAELRAAWRHRGVRRSARDGRLRCGQRNTAGAPVADHDRRVASPAHRERDTFVRARECGSRGDGAS
jgi:hypothetical protein